MPAPDLHTSPRKRPRKRVLALGLLAALGLVAVGGPRPHVDTTIHPLALPTRPAELEPYLAAAEARFPDLRPGAAKTIVWADPARRQRTPAALVYLHGFSATRWETAPLSEQVAERLEANLFYTRLSGHGRSGSALAQASVNDWLNDAHEALEIGRRLGERVVLLGGSTGATLIAWLAARGELDHVAALVMISPNYRPKDPRSAALGWPWAHTITRLVVGSERSWTPHNERQGRHWTTRYPSEALVHMMALLHVVEAQDLGRVRVPTLVLYDPRDQVVSAGAIVARSREIDPALLELEAFTEAEDPSHHVLAGDILSPRATPQVAERILGFLRARLAVPRSR